MNLNQIENIVAIEQEQSISKAAEKLFITQSALNQQLLNLEKELGTPLFERKNRMMLPTFAGQIYLASAHRILDIKKETYKNISDVSREYSGEITIAYSPERGCEMFSDIFPVFNKKYPNIVFKIYEVHVKKMEQLVLQKEVSIAASAYTPYSKNPDIEYIDIDKELLVLGVPSTNPIAGLAGKNNWTTFPEIDLKLLRNEKFVLISKSSRLRSMIDRSFHLAGYQPRVLFESSSTSTAINMVKKQLCCAFFPQSYVKPDPDIAYFSVTPKETWIRSVCYLKGSYLTEPEKYLIDLISHHVRNGRVCNIST